MRIPWEGALCIVCLEAHEFTEEHIIPAAIGGKLTCRFLCKDCNSRLGSRIEGNVKSDPTLQLLAGRLANKIPRLSMELLAGQTYVSVGPGGSSRGFIRNGEFFIQSQKLEDDSLMLPTLLATKTLRRMLEKCGTSVTDTAEALCLFEQASENELIEISPNITARKWSIERIEPALEGPLLNLAAPLKSAYEFLALHLDSMIYDEVPALVAAREALKGAPIDSDHLLIERLHAPIAKPFHGLLFERSIPHCTIQVRLFGQLAFRVHFKTLEVGGPRGIYTHDLELDVEQVAQAGNTTMNNAV